jgi:uncharacterized membrane protein YhaH (DUF805 family)
MIDNYKDVFFKKYAQFSGRARRREFWLFYLANILIEVVVLAFFGIISLIAGSPAPFIIGYVLVGLYGLALIIPGLAVTVRRLHDQGKGGGWIFISLVPIIGSIWLLVLLATAGNEGDNRFGADPKKVQ